MKSILPLAVGVFLVLLALVTAAGAVSIGQSGNGSGGAIWLANSPWVFILSIFLACGGIALVYLAGRDDARLSGAAKQT